MNERDVFIGALQTESRAQRRAYLDEACGGDEGLRRAVETLLEAHDRAGNFLEEPVLDRIGAALVVPTQAESAQRAAGVSPGRDTLPAEAISSRALPEREKSTGTPDTAAHPAAPPPGFLTSPREPDELGRLGHYRVLRLLGQGGMGMVFLADDTRLQRQVALKVMRPELAANPEGRRRFLREAQAAARIRSDHVVTIHHVEQEGNLPYLVMELLRGKSLAEALKEGKRLPLAFCLRIARETAEGLAAAHASGLIHRDVKPGNVWLEDLRNAGGRIRNESSESALWRVKLLDFGLARTIADTEKLTQQGMVIGTPSYMSPEQAGGQPVEARSDLFSLGVVLYRMTTGQEPFNRGDRIATLTAVATEPARPPRELDGEMPAALSDLIVRLLAKDPADRPASAAEVARILRALERDAAGLAPSTGALPEPTAAEAAVREEHPASPVRRRRLALAGSLGSIGLALVLLVAVLTGDFTGRPEGRGSARAAPVTKQAPPAEPPPLREFILTGHRHPQVQALAFTADSKTLVSADFGGQVLFWDLERREETFDLRTQPMGLWCLAVDSRRRWLAIGHLNHEIRLFRFGQREAAWVLKGHTDRVAQLAFLADGRTLLSAGYDGSVRRWDVEKQQEGKLLRARGPRLDCIAVREDGEGGLRLALAGLDRRGFVSMDDQVLEHPARYPDSVALSPDGTRLACTATENNSVALWELPGKTRLALLPAAPTPEGLAFTPHGKHIVVMGLESTHIYETATRKPVARVDHPEKAGALALSPDGRWLAVGTLKGTVRIWHLPSLLTPPG
jgi:serine/threonine protein kinase